MHALSPQRLHSELWEEALLDLRDLQLFLHGAFANAVVRMPSAPPQATSLPLVGAGAAASSATLIAKRKRLGKGPSRKTPQAASSGDPPDSATRGKAGRAKLGTPAKAKSLTPRSSGKQLLGARRQRTPPPHIDLTAGEEDQLGPDAPPSLSSPVHSLYRQLARLRQHLQRQLWVSPATVQQVL
jgi:hypothetical protein